MSDETDTTRTLYLFDIDWRLRRDQFHHAIWDSNEASTRAATRLPRRSATAGGEHERTGDQLNCVLARGWHVEVAHDSDEDAGIILVGVFGEDIASDEGELLASQLRDGDPLIHQEALPHNPRLAQEVHQHDSTLEGVTSVHRVDVHQF